MADYPWEKPDPNYRSEKAPIVGGASNSARNPWEGATLERKGERLRKPGSYGRGARHAQERWQNMPTIQRLMTRTRSVGSGIPGIRHFVDQTNPDLATHRTANPTQSSIEQGVGHTLPYVGAALAVPKLMGSVAGNVAAGAGIEGADAAIGGGGTRQIIEQGGMGAALGLPGPAISKFISPRTSSQTIQAAARNRGVQIQRSNDARDKIIRDNSGAIEGELNRIRAQYPSLSYQDARDIAIGTVVPDLGSRARGILGQPVRREVPRMTDLPTPYRSLIGGLAAPMVGAHPLVGAAAGAVIGPAARGVRNVTERAINSRAANKYLDNKILSDKNRAILNALMTGGGNEVIQQTLGGN